ncbi:hepatic sodium/bile acid cotransporter-like [Pempheris klunzingeri]|uniref:hepatic sodium/bile acid cotransporter-like n=1 Tax=Pempheris klunzingeri TaxID=3127111 RepID=UPI00397FFEDB
MSAVMNVTEIYNGIVTVYNEGNVSGNESVAVSEQFPMLNKTINFFVIIVLIITMISVGSTMEITKIKTHIRKPKGVIIALLAQFGIMPLTAFSLAKILQLNSIKAIAVLTCGCCPGGHLSNVLSLAAMGDMNLSILMTTCSSIVALGMMPLLLFIYCQGFKNLENAVPYVGIITALTLILVPCGIGIAINHYKPKYSAVIRKTGLSILVICSIIGCALSGIAYRHTLWLLLTADVLAVATLLPLTGYTLGYVMAITCKLSPQSCRTISMETGCQNVQLCVAILKVAFDQQDIGPMFLFPLIYIVFQSTEAIILALGFRCYRALKPPAEDTTYHVVDGKQEEVKQP